jgi:hypothetical protein
MAKAEKAKPAKAYELMAKLLKGEAESGKEEKRK